MRTSVCFAALLLAAASAMLNPPSALADDKDAVTDMARRRFQEGVKFFDQKKFEEARGAFLQAYALKRHPAVLLNLAQSEIRSGHPAEAARHFASYLRDTGSGSSLERSEAEKGLREARAKLSRIQISAPNGTEILVDGESVGQAPLAEPVDVTPGSHTVEGRQGGRSTTSSVSVVVGRLGAATLSFDAPPPAAAAPPPVVAPQPEPAAPPPAAPAPAPEPEPAPAAQETPKAAPPEPPKKEEPAPPQPPDDEREGFFTWVGHSDLALLSLGVAGVGVGVFIGFGLAAQSADDNVASVASKIRKEGAAQKISRTNLCADPVPFGFDVACNTLKDNMETRDLDATLSTVGLVAAGAGVAATVAGYFLLSDKSTPTRAGKGTVHTAKAGPRATFTPYTAPHQVGFTVIGSF